ncbi:hypothetical protein AB0L71_14020 [Streptomyces sp. NPDC052052]|uniref:hypothetical protein n=1 Tax=Streptomyces sp. NPDC052052 TaxID=3154756 RepID=UPI00341FB7AD
MAAATIVLGAAGCGTSDADAGVAATSAPAPPRPKGTGPLAKEVVRTDIDTSAADAGVPANAPDYGRTYEDASDGSPQSCSVGFKGFSTKTTTVDIARYKAVLGELRERDWQQPQEQKEHKEVRDGVVHVARVPLKQRGWTMVVEYRASPVDNVITLAAFEDACMKKIDAEAWPVD